MSRNQEFFMHLHVDLVNGKRKTKLIFSWYLCKQFSWDPGKGDLPVGDKWKGRKTKDFSPTNFICPAATGICLHDILSLCALGWGPPTCMSCNVVQIFTFVLGRVQS